MDKVLACFQCNGNTFLKLFAWKKKKNTLIVVLDSQQTNTADMLDLAVDYIKDLQKQVKVYWAFGSGLINLNYKTYPFLIFHGSLLFEDTIGKPCELHLFCWQAEAIPEPGCVNLLYGKAKDGGGTDLRTGDVSLGMSLLPVGEGPNEADAKEGNV